MNTYTSTSTYYVWPDGINCDEFALEEFLQFMSDDYETVKISDDILYEDLDDAINAVVHKK